MFALIDYYLDRITMYRLALYYLTAILVVALGLASFSLLPYPPWAIFLSTGLLTVVCLITNDIFAKVFDVPTNVESAYITAFILACIVTPASTIHGLPILFWSGVLAMGAKYILAIRSKHIFNPAAIAVVLTGFWLNQPATWWVGTTYLVPIVVIGGVLLMRKLRRYDMVFTFFVVALLTIGFFTISRGTDLLRTLDQVLLKSPFFFFGFMMLTEPLTSPPTNKLQMVFAGLVGVLYAPQLHFGTLYLTPELALVTGNLFNFIVSPRVRERLTLKSVTPTASGVFSFIFEPKRKFNFRAGQYLEFTLPHTHSDTRGNRRYFTIASSPTEPGIELGVKFYEKRSSFKNTLFQMKPGEKVMVGQLAGDFTLPKNKTEKVVFIAGGIGITPFRSMVKYMLDTNQDRPTILIYMNKTIDEIAYREIFDQAARENELKTVHVLTDSWPEGWTGRTGHVSSDLIKEEVPDYKERTFYLSGPHGMVVGMEKALSELGVTSSRIKKDFFPGLV